MAFTPANSSAMDAATGAGPSTLVLPSIVTGQVEAVLAYAAKLATQAATFAGQLAELERAAQQLGDVWSGGAASENVLAKLAKSFEAFNNIISAAKSAVTELERSAGQVDIAQTAYNAVVGVVNPIVQALTSNPYTEAAGVALAEATTAVLSAFVEGIGAVLDAIGIADIARIVSDLISIAQDIDTLFNSGAEHESLATAAMVANIVLAPKPVDTVASGAGQAAVNGSGTYSYRPAALESI